MTYNEALSTVHKAYYLNQEDEALGGYTDAPVGTPTTGYRVYAIDEQGHRYSPVRGVKSEALEHGVYYWHNLEIAKAYMVYLADAYRSREQTYGIFRVEAIKGNRHESIYDEHSAHYGQVATDLNIIDDELQAVLTPEMLRLARQNPNHELFS